MWHTRRFGVIACAVAALMGVSLLAVALVLRGGGGSSGDVTVQFLAVSEDMDSGVVHSRAAPVLLPTHMPNRPPVPSRLALPAAAGRLGAAGRQQPERRG